MHSGYLIFVVILENICNLTEVLQIGSRTATHSLGTAAPKYITLIISLFYCFFPYLTL